MIAATILLCALGHAVRDGIPPLDSTHAARALGGFFCTLGGFLLTFEWPTTLMGLALYVGFYADMLHGEGARARGWRDVPALIVSGCSSLAPLTAVAAALSWRWAWLVPLVGVIKPAIWFASWRVPRVQPTRLAAVSWGALTGLLIGLMG